eukprot:3081632-Rhodomonas_salina.3
MATCPRDRAALRGKHATPTLMCMALVFSVLLSCAQAVPLNRKAQDSGIAGHFREIVVAVKSNAPHLAFEQAFQDTSSLPRSQEHLTLSQICDVFGPSPASVEAVAQWAARFGGHISEKTTCQVPITPLR